VVHLGHPERGFEMFLTPSTSSAMAMFGFVYAWYLMFVLLLEIWFDYRHDLVVRASTEKGLKRLLYRVLSLFSHDISMKAVLFDKKAVNIITIIGIPSAFLLHGYVGFIFGSVKANPWWSSVLMPIVFLFSAIVSGIALMLLIYMIVSLVRKMEPDMACLDKLASFLFYMMIVDFALEASISCTACTNRRNRYRSFPSSYRSGSSSAWWSSSSSSACSFRSLPSEPQRYFVLPMS